MKIKSCSYSRGVENFAPRIKSYSEITTIAVEEPDIVYIPTKQMKGHLPIVVVTKGDEVKIGTRLAVSGNNIVCSTVSGLVEDVVTLPSVYGGATEVVVIKNNHKNDKEKFTTHTIEETSEELTLAAKVASIVDYDGSTVIDKLNTLGKENEKTLIVNMVDDEPYLYNNALLLADKKEECVFAIKLMAKILNTNNVFIAVKNDEMKLHSPFFNQLTNEGFDLNVVAATIPNRYPAGDEVQLVQTIMKRKFKSLTECRSAGFVAFDMFTLYALSKLVIEGEYTTRRPLTIIEKDGNKIKSVCAWVNVGMTINDVLNALYLNGVQGIRKIVAGGPMRGIALGNEMSSITFGLKAIMAIKDKLTDAPSELPCITCGKCAKVCPVGIVPYEIDECTLDRDFNEAVKLGANKCIKCGCCSYVCPSKRYLTQRIYYAKEIINNKGLKNE